MNPFEKMKFSWSSGMFSLVFLALTDSTVRLFVDVNPLFARHMNPSIVCGPMLCARSHMDCFSALSGSNLFFF